MPAFIYLGPELGKKQEAVNILKKKFPNAEETVFYAGEAPAKNIADTLQNHSLFADLRIITIKNADAFRKDEEDILVPCIKKIRDDTLLILLSDEFKLSAAVDGSVPKSNLQVFYELFEREKKDWVRKFFSNEGITIENDGIDAILEMVENNTEAMKNECSRLVLFLAKDKPVTLQDVDKWLSHNREESSFTLFSRIAAGDLSKSLESASSILAGKEGAQKMLAGLAYCYRRLGSYLTLLEKGEAGNTLELKKISLSSPQAKNDCIAASRRYSTDDVEACLALTAECDILLRSPVADMEKILVDRYIYKIVNKVF